MADTRYRLPIRLSQPIQAGSEWSPQAQLCARYGARLVDTRRTLVDVAALMIKYGIGVQTRGRVYCRRGR